jgi:hypothetical protein
VTSSGETGKSQAVFLVFHETLHTEILSWWEVPLRFDSPSSRPVLMVTSNEQNEFWRAVSLTARLSTSTRVIMLNWGFTVCFVHIACVPCAKYIK